MLYPYKGRGKRGNIVVDANVPPFSRARNILLRTQILHPRRKFCIRDAKNVSELFQKHFASATNVSPFARLFRTARA